MMKRFLQESTTSMIYLTDSSDDEDDSTSKQQMKRWNPPSSSTSTSTSSTSAGIRPELMRNKKSFKIKEGRTLESLLNTPAVEKRQRKTIPFEKSRRKYPWGDVKSFLEKLVTRDREQTNESSEHNNNNNNDDFNNNNNNKAHDDNLNLSIDGVPIWYNHDIMSIAGASNQKLYFGSTSQNFDPTSLSPTARIEEEEEEEDDDSDDSNDHNDNGDGEKKNNDDDDDENNNGDDQDNDDSEFDEEIEIVQEPLASAPQRSTLEHSATEQSARSSRSFSEVSNTMDRNFDISATSLGTTSSKQVRASQRGRLSRSQHDTSRPRRSRSKGAGLDTRSVHSLDPLMHLSPPLFDSNNDEMADEIVQQPLATDRPQLEYSTRSNSCRSLRVSDTEGSSSGRSPIRIRRVLRQRQTRSRSRSRHDPNRRRRSRSQHDPQRTVSRPTDVKRSTSVQSGLEEKKERRSPRRPRRIMSHQRRLPETDRKDDRLLSKSEHGNSSRNKTSLSPIERSSYHGQPRSRRRLSAKSLSPSERPQQGRIVAAASPRQQQQQHHQEPRRVSLRSSGRSQSPIRPSSCSKLQQSRGSIGSRRSGQYSSRSPRTTPRHRRVTHTGIVTGTEEAKEDDPKIKTIVIPPPPLPLYDSPRSSAIDKTRKCYRSNSSRSLQSVGDSSDRQSRRSRRSVTSALAAVAAATTNRTNSSRSLQSHGDSSDRHSRRSKRSVSSALAAVVTANDRVNSSRSLQSMGDASDRHSRRSKRSVSAALAAVAAASGHGSSTSTTTTTIGSSSSSSNGNGGRKAFSHSPRKLGKQSIESADKDGKDAMNDRGSEEASPRITRKKSITPCVPSSERLQQLLPRRKQSLSPRPRPQRKNSNSSFGGVERLTNSESPRPRVQRKSSTSSFGDIERLATSVSPRPRVRRKNSSSSFGGIERLAASESPRPRVRRKNSNSTFGGGDSATISTRIRRRGVQRSSYGVERTEPSTKTTSSSMKRVSSSPSILAPTATPGRSLFVSPRQRKKPSVF